MNERASKASGNSPSKAGERARELLRRAKQASRGKFPAEEETII